MQPGHKLRKLANMYGLRVHRYSDQCDGRRFARVALFLEEDKSNAYPVVSCSDSGHFGNLSSYLSYCSHKALLEFERLEENQKLLAKIKGIKARVLANNRQQNHR